MGNGNRWVSLYPALKNLERRGLIKRSRIGKRGKIVYSLTKEGRSIISGFRRKIKSTKLSRLSVMDIHWPNEPKELREEVNLLITRIIELRNFSEKKKYEKNEIRRIVGKVKRAIRVLEVRG